MTNEQAERVAKALESIAESLSHFVEQQGNMSPIFVEILQPDAEAPFRVEVSKPGDTR